jgi:pimeloyl-ACP methyl ester carboxylesterase
VPATRDDVAFTSGGERVAAWLYRPADAGPGPVPCVVMAHGFSLTRHDGLPAYAEVLAAAGAAVLVFDHRYLGDSGGAPRQRFRAADQLEDWRAAIATARRLEGIDPARIVLWGFSFSGGHVTTLLTKGEQVAAALVLCPFVAGLPRVLRTAPRLVAWILPRGLLDLAGRPVLIPVTGEPGTRAAMTFPGERAGFARAVPDGSPWRNEISPGLFVTIALHRPVARARSISCPLWVGLGGRDVSVHGPAVEKLAGRAPRGELQRYPEYDHFDPFVGDAPGRVAGDQVEFLRRVGVLPA